MTTTCVTIDQPSAPLLLLAVDDMSATEWATYGVIPAGLPSASSRVAAMEFTLSIAEALDDDPVLIGVFEPDASADVAGTWSGASGSVDTVSGIDYWSVPDWGTWTTDYLSFPSGADTDDLLGLTNTESHATSEWDFQMRCRTADWDSTTDASGNQLFGSTAFGAVNVKRTASGLNLQSRYNLTPSGQANTNLTCTWGTLGFTDDEWEWVRVTADATNGIRWWTGGPGSWSVVQTDSLPGSWASWTGMDEAWVGNGKLASSLLGAGFNGDVSHCTLADTVGGSPWLDMNIGPDAVDGPSSDSDTSWSSTGDASDWTLGDDVTVNGSNTSGTVTVRFDFGATTTFEDFLVWVEPPTGGNVVVDQWCLEIPDRQRIGLGWMVA